MDKACQTQQETFTKQTSSSPLLWKTQNDEARCWPSLEQLLALEADSEASS